MKGRMKTFSVDVTQEDIDNGKRRQPRFCPVALALNRALKGKVDAYVSVVTATLIFRRFLIPDKKTRIILPKHVRSFILGFDNREPVSPISFTVEV